MSSISSGSSVRRYLSFEDLPYRGKRFYLDIKKAAEKSKLGEQIVCLGGTVDGFLTKELSLIVTDRATDKPEGGSLDGKKSVKSQLPLSRGQALLKASQHQGRGDGGHTQDGFLQTAANLGVSTQKASTFIRATSKLLAKIKSRRKRCVENDLLEGMSPIKWDKDKENACIIKVEDNENVFRPLFKQFDTFPEVDYSQSASPFDVGVVLIKEGKENNQAKKKTAGPGVVKGGFCESCDHWYKCSLREHLKSDKHKAFVKSTDNFKSLDNLVISLPNLGNFFGKHGVEYESEDQFRSNEQSHAPVGNGQKPAVISSGSSLSAIECIVPENNSTIDETKETQSNCKSEQLSELSALNSFASHSEFSKSHQKKSDRNIFEQLTKTKSISEYSLVNSLNKGDKSVSSERRLTLNEVLSNVFEADNAVDGFDSFEEDDDKENCDPSQLHKGAGLIPQKSEELDLHPCVAECQSKHAVSTHSQSSSNQSVSLNNALHDNGYLRNVPEASFSSSCSFGDNGVGKIISYLQTNESRSSVHGTIDTRAAMLQTNDSRSSVHGSSDARAVLQGREDRNSVSGQSDISGCSRNFVTKFMSNFCNNASDKVETNSLASQSGSSTRPGGCVSKSLSMSNSFNNSSDKVETNSLVSKSDTTLPGGYISKSLSVFNNENKVVGKGSSHMSESVISSFSEALENINALSSTVPYASSGQISNSMKLDTGSINSNIDSEHSRSSKPVETHTQSACEQPSGFFPQAVQTHNSSSIQSVTEVKQNAGTPQKDVKQVNDHTPIGKSMKFAQPTLEDLCRSGSSIRNWLVPDDDNMSVKTVVSKLDHTLVEQDNSPMVISAEHEEMPEAGDKINSAAEDLPRTDNGGACSLVASWIQTQEFTQDSGIGILQDNSKTQSCDNNIEKGIRVNGQHLDVDNQGSVHDSSLKGDSASDLVRNAWPSDSASDLVRNAWPSDSVSDVRDAWPDTCSYTSVSDCTVFSDKNIAKQTDSADLMSVKSATDLDRCGNSMTIGMVDVKAIKNEHGENSKSDSYQGLQTHLERSEQRNVDRKEETMNNVASLIATNSNNAGSRHVNVDIGKNFNTVSNDKPYGAFEGNTSLLKTSGEIAVQNTESAIEKPQVAKQSGNKAKPKAKRNTRQTKVSEAKKKGSKAKQKPLCKTVTTQQMNIQPLPQSQTPWQNPMPQATTPWQNQMPQSPTPWQNPIMTQVMYSPISMPSESAPVDPSSPYTQQMWQKSAAYLSHAHTQPFSSINQPGYSMNMAQCMLQGSQGFANPGPLHVGVNSPHSQLTQDSSLYHQNVSVDTSYQSSMLDLLCSPRSQFSTQGSEQHQTFTQGCGTAQNAGFRNHNVSGYPSVPGVYQGPGIQYPAGSQHEIGPVSGPISCLEPAGYFGHAGSPLTQNKQYGSYPENTDQSVPSSGMHQSDGNLSTIRLTDIADDGSGSSMYTDSTRYIARPKRKHIPASSYTQPAHSGDNCRTTDDRNVSLNERPGSGITMDAYSTNPGPSVPTIPITQGQACYANSPMHAQSAGTIQHSQQQSNNTSYPVQSLGSAMHLQQGTQQNNCQSAIHKQQGTELGQSTMHPQQGTELCQSTMHLQQGTQQNNCQSAMHLQQGTELCQSENSVYNAVQTGAMKLRLSKLPSSNVQEPKSNLTHYWNVRKTGECRLVFSSSMLGKRKAEDTPVRLDYLQTVPSPYSAVSDDEQQQSKRRRCLVF